MGLDVHYVLYTRLERVSSWSGPYHSPASRNSTLLMLNPTLVNV